MPSCRPDSPAAAAGCRSRSPRADNALRSLGRRVRAHPRTNLAQLVALGRLLIQARQDLGYRKFGRWLGSIDLPYSRRVASEAMTATKRLAKLPLPLDRFAVSAVRILARTKVARSPDLVEALAAIAAKPGPPVTFARARDVVTSEAPTAVYPPPQSAGRTETPAEAIGRRLVDLVLDERVGSITIIPNRDPEQPLVTVSILGEERRSATRPYLASALAAAVGEESLRRCPHPKHEGENPLPQSLFNRFCHYCKICDRRRVREWDQRRKRRRTPAN
jgi:hypothetical protein